METTTLKDILSDYKSDKIWAGDYAYTGWIQGKLVEVYIKATVALMEGRSYTRGGGWELEVYIDGIRRGTWSFSRTKRAALGKAVEFLQKYQEEAQEIQPLTQEEAQEIRSEMTRENLEDLETYEAEVASAKVQEEPMASRGLTLELDGEKMEETIKTVNEALRYSCPRCGTPEEEFTKSRAGVTKCPKCGARLRFGKAYDGEPAWVALIDGDANGVVVTAEMIARAKEVQEEPTGEDDPWSRQEVQESVPPAQEEPTEPPPSPSSFGLDERFDGLVGLTKEAAVDLHALVRAVDFYQSFPHGWTLQQIQENKDNADPSCGWPAILAKWVKEEAISGYWD